MASKKRSKGRAVSTTLGEADLAATGVIDTNPASSLGVNRAEVPEEGLHTEPCKGLHHTPPPPKKVLEAIRLECIKTAKSRFQTEWDFSDFAKRYADQAPGGACQIIDFCELSIRGVKGE